MNELLASIMLIAGLVTGAAAAWIIAQTRRSAGYEARLAALGEQVVSRDRQVAEQRERILAREAEIRALQESRGELQAQSRALQTCIEKEREANEDKLEILEEAGERLKMEFQNLANRIFEDKSEKFTRQNRDNLHDLLNPLREQLGEFRKRIDDVYDKESKDRVSLLGEILRLKELNQQISVDAVNLTNALKGESKTQGTWGEVILERVLETSGLQKGREYETQVHVRDAAGRGRLLDALVHLPDDREVVIDAKVSLKAYEQYCSAAGAPAREAALLAHLESVRAHIKELGAKDYAGLLASKTLDFVLMFMPVEAAFLTAVGNSPDLYEEAFRFKIMLVSPSTLQLTLRIIANIWRREQQNQNAFAIASRAAELYDRFVGFIDELDHIGKSLGDAQKAYEESRKRLCEGKGNLIRQVEMLKELGVKPKKSLPAALLDASAEDQDAPDANNVQSCGGRHQEPPPARQT